MLHRALLPPLLLAAMLAGASSVGAQTIGSTPLPPPPGMTAAPYRPAPPSTLPPPAGTTLRHPAHPPHPVPRHLIRPPSQLGHVPVLPPPGGPARRPPRKAAPPAAPATHATPPHPATTARHTARLPPPKPAVPATPAPVAPAPPPPPKIDPTKGATTGLTLPRWASFRSDEVNLRSGPGMQYPIDWVYHRRDLPVRIEREFEVWRLVELQDGTKGWVHQATLTARRGFVVGGADVVLRASGADTADAVATLKAGVVGHVVACASGAAWCQVEAGSYRGWLKRDSVYGISPAEAIP